MKRNKFSLFIMFLAVVLILSVTLPPVANANSSLLKSNVSSEDVLEIEGMLEEIEEERIQTGQVSEEKVKILEEKLISLKKEADNQITPFAGQTIDLGAGWSMRVDVPKTGDDAQYHVHVTNKKLGIDAAEGVNGNKSHKKTLSGSGVPKKIIEKVKDHKDFKNAEKKQKKLDDAAKEIKAKKLDLNKTTDIIIAIAIVVAATATFFFPGDDVLAWGALLRAIAK